MAAASSQVVLDTQRTKATAIHAKMVAAKRYSNVGYTFIVVGYIYFQSAHLSSLGLLVRLTRFNHRGSYDRFRDVSCGSEWK